MALLQFVVRVAMFAASLLVYSYLDLLDLKVDLSEPLRLIASSAPNTPPTRCPPRICSISFRQDAS